MIESLGSGVFLGLAAGFTPGPLTVLVIGITLRYSVREGAKVALAPIMTDLPIVALSFVMAGFVAEYGSVLGVISLAGAAFVLYLAYETMTVKGVEIDPQVKPRSFQKGFLTNLLSPHPYLFWFTIGAAMLGRHLAVGWSAAVGFLVGFYAGLVGSKLILAVVSGRVRNVLTGRPYLIVMRLLGLALVGLAGFLVRDGIRLLGQ